MGTVYPRRIRPWRRCLVGPFGQHRARLLYPQKERYTRCGANWSRPNEGTFGPGLNDQYTEEIYYRFHLLKVLTLTPDVQLLLTPLKNRTKIWSPYLDCAGELAFRLNHCGQFFFQKTKSVFNVIVSNITFQDRAQLYSEIPIFKTCNLFLNFDYFLFGAEREINASAD